jgi:isoleucyl-tRNA synthetase
MYKKIDSKSDFPKLEEEILEYWEEQNIFQQSIERDAPAGDFVFYEGPPTANGKPGLHHVLARAFKDAVPRYKTMKGYRVRRKAGWDTHGLPVELQVEKALGIRSKQEIEELVPGDPRASVIEFNKKCKESVWEYRDLWEKLTRRMGYWVDMAHPYVTYEDSYIESVWWQFAQIAGLKDADGNDLLYRGHKVVPYCYRCGTALSSHEVAQGYKEVKDQSAYVKFRVRKQETGNRKHGEAGETYLLAWTTTPWTLPGNVALAVGRDIEYVRFTVSQSTDERFQVGETYILAKEAITRLLGSSEGYAEGSDSAFSEKGGSVIWSSLYTHSSVSAENYSILLGKDLIGLSYEPLFDATIEAAAEEGNQGAWQVYAGDFVTTEDGTGVVHIAPAFGEDDAELAREHALPTVHTVDLEGKMMKGFPGAGVAVKKKNDRNKGVVDTQVLEDLRDRGLLFGEETYEHDYPHCWRCDTPLVYYAKASWFIAMSKLRDQLVENAERIDWVPEHIKDGRFGEWIRGAKDWAISRDRYWGTPIPVWECDACGERSVIASRSELETLAESVPEDLHKPYIDDVQWKCQCGKGTMKRTPEVLDVWFDSGAMPLAQLSYPRGADDDAKKGVESGTLVPADYISEAIDQTRGWFYTLHAIATLLNEAGVLSEPIAYRNVVCLGHLLDAKGKKMSKSKGNVVEPTEMFDTYGADALRWYLYSINQPGLPKRFDEKGMREVMSRVFRMLWNSYSFFTTYASIDNWSPQESMKPSENLLDRWILSELQVLVRDVSESLEAYDLFTPTGKIESFIDNLSNWYIRRSRKRFWKSEDDADKEDAYATLHTVLVTLSQLMAPFTPFLSEDIYRNLSGCHSGLSTGECSVDPESTDVPESVHLSFWPEADEGLIDEQLDEEMEKLRTVVSEGLRQRAEAGIKVRQPLEKVTVGKKYHDLFETSENKMYLLYVACEELNVKSVLVDKKLDDEEVFLDTKITPQLKLEGEAREIVRAIQEGRKAAGFEVSDRITLGIVGKETVFDGNPEEELAGFGEMIAHETLATEVIKGDIVDADYREIVKIGGEMFSFALKRNS